MAKVYILSTKISNKHEFLLKLEKNYAHMWLQLQSAFSPLKWTLTCFASCKAATHMYSAVLLVLWLKSLQSISSSGKSVALLVKEINQQKS